MSTRLAVTAITAAMGLVGSVVSLQASACAFTDLKSASSSEQQEAFIQFAAGIGVAPAESARPSSAANFIIQRGPHLPIVGLWKFAFTATDGSPIDWGFQTWHSDGTEITNSGGRPAEVGNFCMGVWQQAGDGGYSLNHWAIAWGPPPNFDPTVLAGLVNIREVVYINRTGNSMSGTVSEELYAPDGVTPITSLGNGTVSGTRITP